MRRFFMGILLMSLLGGSGCSGFKSMAHALKPGDYANPTELESEQWIQQAGMEARGDRGRESSGDPAWYRQHVMSEKARDIERHFNIYE